MDGNGYGHNGLDEKSFGPSDGLLKAFDAFPKSKPQYVTRTSGGGKWTVTMVVISIILVITEVSWWWQGHYEEHTFAVEKGVGHDLDINIDITIAMRCDDLNVNVQDASGDRILAGEMLKRDLTDWDQWVNARGIHQLGRDENGKLLTGEGWQYLYHDEGFGQEHVHDIVDGARKTSKWAKTPKFKGEPVDGNSCRIFGTLSVNKVQGDFHITARGHGYIDMDVPGHLEHGRFNFSHIISELSFGPFYPSLLNPLDRTVASTVNHFYKFQYFLSVVPTIYTVTTGGSSLRYNPKRTIVTNQYAVTEQSYMVGEQSIPGIYFKYDIEPILLTVVESHDSLLRLCVKLVNILSGALVAGHWGFIISEWALAILGKARREEQKGMLHGEEEEAP